MTSDTGERVSLSSLRAAEFERRGAVVLGVSPQGERSHAKFRDKYGLPFTLLADEDHAAAEKYGVWVQKSFAGRTGRPARDQRIRPQQLALVAGGWSCWYESPLLH